MDKHQNQNDQIEMNNQPSQQQRPSIDQILKQQTIESHKRFANQNIWNSAFNQSTPFSLPQTNPASQINRLTNRIISHQSIADNLQEQSENQGNDNYSDNNQFRQQGEQKREEFQRSIDQQQAQQNDQVPEGEINSIPSLNKKRTHKKSDVSTFIMKTYKILDDRRNSSIVEWADEGNCFIVKDRERFQNQILPKYFKHRKFSSFVRQLNMYDFHKIRKEKQIPIFRHKYFKQGGIDLLHKIKRKSGEQGRQDEGSLINQQTPRVQGQGRATSIAKSLANGNISVQNSYNYLMSTHSQVEVLMRQNAELQHSIAQISKQINCLQMSKDRKREKLMKVISAMMFFDLKHKAKKFQDNLDNPEQADAENLRNLQQHFIKDEEPWSFSEYSDQLCGIYSYIKNTVLGSN